MPFEDAIRSAKDGVIIDFEVTPSSKNPCVPSGYNVWRKRIEARLKAPPEKGKANEELITAVSELMKVSAADIEITSGATNTLKSLKVKGADITEVREVFRGKI